MAYKSRKDIKVSEAYIQKLRDAGTKKAALEKYGSSTDPKMREALRRFYGANTPAPLKDSPRTRERTLPKSGIPMGKPKGMPSRNMAPARGGTPYKPTPKSSTATKKTIGKKVDSAVRNIYKYAGPANFIAGGVAVKAGMTAGKAASKTAKAISIAKNTKKLETAKGSAANLAQTKIGKAKGLATKTEVKQAKAAVSKKRGK